MIIYAFLVFYFGHICVDTFWGGKTFIGANFFLFNTIYTTGQGNPHFWDKNDPVGRCFYIIYSVLTLQTLVIFIFFFMF